MTAVMFDREVASGQPRLAAGFAPRAKSWVGPRHRRSGSRLVNVSGDPKNDTAVERSAIGDVQVHNEGFEYAVARITELLNDGLARPGTAVRFLRVLRRIQSPDHVFPHISADEDGELIAFWSADKMSLELSVPSEGDVYLRMTDRDGREVVVGFFRWLPNAEVRGFLSRLSRVVALSNPRWRRLFAS